MSKVRVIKTVSELQNYRSQLTGQVGFVPTMGALHHGHEKLLQASLKTCDHTILSIFVNPTQFNDAKDFEKYPVTWEDDLKIAEKNQISAIFYPKYQELYPDHYTYKISETEFSKLLCGATRPGHFDGVLTVVMKLFQIVKPDLVFFGEKDFQQLTLIEGLVKAFFLPIQIIPVTTERESSGLALSSRNTRLSPEGKLQAAKIYQTLMQKLSLDDIRKQLETAGFSIDYLTEYKGRRYIAAFLEGVRLIDNVNIP